ncbi:MAG: hypothetical protein GX357_08545 [Firmicutes bacterium]|nr:hypothetical protein [Bacillota bacterium]
MKRGTFIILALVLVVLVGLYVKAGMDRAKPDTQQTAGPPTPHDTTGAYSDCLNCHGNIISSHDEHFGEGNYDDCLSCHRTTQ